MNTCEHEFVSGPFYLLKSTSWEEPTFYSPSGTSPVEHCKKCGMLRLSPDALDNIESVRLQQVKLFNRID